MKTSVTSCGIPLSLLIILLIFQAVLTRSQDQNNIRLKHNDINKYSLLDLSIAKLHFDILAPTLNTYGKGLHYYECILMESQNMIGSSSGKTKDETVINKSVYTDLEMDLFRQNLLFINKQSKIQIQEWIKKDKWDLNLGEAIKGFYQAPVF